MSPRVVTRTRELTVCLSVPVIVMIRGNHLDPCFPSAVSGGHTQQGSQQGEGTFGFSPRGSGFPLLRGECACASGPVRLGYRIAPGPLTVGGSVVVSGGCPMCGYAEAWSPRGLVLSPPTPLAAPSLAPCPSDQPPTRLPTTNQHSHATQRESTGWRPTLRQQNNDRRR